MRRLFHVKKMKTNVFLLGAILLVYFVSISHCQDYVTTDPAFSAGVVTGYNRGYGIQANFTFHGFAKEFPFEIRFGIGYSFFNPGKAWDARRIFINNATNGVPEKKGRSLDCRIDFLLAKSIFRLDHSYVVFGPRYSTYRGNFKYTGGNEDFDVKSQQWGLGGGIENHFKMARNLDLVVTAGLDFYLPGTLTGHDTSYSPDNDNVNPREDIFNGDIYFTYKDADRIIYQPRFMPRAMIGINFHL